MAGRLTDGRGITAAQAKATLVAWPPVNRNQREGDRIKLLPVSVASTDSQGNFRLTLRRSAELEQYIDPTTRLLDLDVLAQSGDERGTYSFTVTIPPATGGSLTGVRLARDETRSADTGVTIRLRGPAAPTSRTPSASSRDVAPSTAAVLPKLCSTTTGPSYYPYVLTGSLYSTWSGFTGSYEYKTSATSNLGVGYSISGAYGTFSQSGTSTKSSSQTFTWNQTGIFYKYYKPQWKYTKYDTWCGSGWVYSTYHYVRPQFATGGGTTTSFSSAPSATRCVAQSGYSWTTDNETALTWTNGVSIKSALGVDLSANSSWTDNNRISITNGKYRHVCGTRDYPGGTFGELVVKP
ncbi:hypothetical protein GCM10027053_18120 [Intrasporangium mesophilum]